MVIARAQRRLGVLLAACCALATAPLHAQTVGHERRLDDPIEELMPRRLWEPAVAMAGEQFLLVWTEGRLSSDAQLINQVMAARVTPDGEVLDPRGIAVATTSGLRREPRVTANGDGFIVMWRESRQWGPDRVGFARIDRDGQVLDPEGRELPLEIAELECSDGQCLAAAAAQLDPLAKQLELHVRGLDECGTASNESALTVPPPTSSQSFTTATGPRIVSNCSGHTIALGEHDEKSGETWIQLAGYELDGTMRYSRKLQTVMDGTTVQPNFDLAANDRGELLLIWQEGVDWLWSLRTDRNGEPLAPAKRMDTRGRVPVLAFDGDGYVLACCDDTVDVMWLDADGEPRGGVVPQRITPEADGARDHVRLAAGASGALVTWRPESTTNAGERNAALLTPDGRVLTPGGLAVAASANQQWGAQLVRDADGYTLTFRDDRPDTPGPRTVHLDAHGEPDPATTQVIDPEPAGQPQASSFPPTLVKGDGAVLEIRLGRGLLCGEDQACDTTLSLTVLDAQGKPDPAKPSVTFGPDGEWARSDAVGVYDGEGFVVAFRQGRVDAPVSDGSVRVVYVALDGSVRPAEPNIVTRNPQAVYERPVAIAAAASGYLLVLAHSSALGSAQDVSLFTLRIDRALQLLDVNPIELTAGDAERTRVGVADDGEAWLLVWQERAEGHSWDIHGARVPHAGGAINAFNVAVSSLDELAPTIAASSPGHALVAYERFDDDPSAMIGRVFVREIEGSDACDGGCCGECPKATPTAEECVAMDHLSTCGGTATAKRARYGCGCEVVGTAGGHKAAWATLLMAAFGVVLGRRAARRAGNLQRRGSATGYEQAQPRSALTNRRGSHHLRAMDIVLYSVIGATVYLVAWIVPGLFIKNPLVRVPAQVVTMVIAAFFLPMPKDTKVAYLAGQYAFVGGVVLVGLWSMIQKMRKG